MEHCADLTVHDCPSLWLYCVPLSIIPLRAPLLAVQACCSAVMRLLRLLLVWVGDHCLRPGLSGCM